MVQINKNLLFYKIMKYPVPTQADLFIFQEDLKTKYQIPKNIKNHKSKPENKIKNNNFSRKEKNKFMDKFIKIINQYWEIYKSLPFIKEIYLCNSITFNALKRDSDIDLFIVVQKWKMRRARLASAIFFKLLWAKRSITDKKQKFCLSFYVTQDNQNLYPLMIDKTDIYLTYWLGHLVPLYQETSPHSNIYKNNKRFWSLMPQHPQEHTINIWNKLFQWKNKTKITLEFIMSGIVWYTIELIIKIIRLPILIYKTKRLWEIWKHIVISNKILKFHNDARQKIHLLYQIAQKK